ncbi:Cochaperone prefoldin complex subunit [Coemansia sp. RSA 2708]|nr:Cochaperone prefoldin complex subunit [Coemansia sp. RSA 2708]
MQNITEVQCNIRLGNHNLDISDIDFSNFTHLKLDAAIDLEINMSEQELRLRANQYSNELKQLGAKIGELESELNEHHLVIETVSKVPGDRKCFRLVNGVLVERTAGEVLPALRTNEEGIKSTIKQLTDQYKAKDKEFIDFQQKNHIRIASAQ